MEGGSEEVRRGERGGRDVGGMEAEFLVSILDVSACPGCGGALNRSAC